jgi:hypothetical protein
VHLYRYVLSEIFDLAAHSAYWNALSGYCNVAPLGAQPSYTTVEPAPQNSIPIVLISAGVLVALVSLAGCLMCVCVCVCVCCEKRSVKPVEW